MKRGTDPGNRPEEEGETAEAKVEKIVIAATHGIEDPEGASLALGVANAAWSWIAVPRSFFNGSNAG